MIIKLNFLNEDMGLKEYQIKNNKKTHINYQLNRKTNNEIIVIEGDVINHLPLQSVSITINGIKNKLSKSTSPYYNQNTHFTYLLTAQQLSISLSKGHYDLKNIQTYSLNKNALKNIKVDPLSINKGKDILNGTINVSNDGYFITRIPYDRGYQILVDHQEVKSEVVNEAFLGCKNQKGKHQIQIKFTHMVID